MQQNFNSNNSSSSSDDTKQTNKQQQQHNVALTWSLIFNETLNLILLKMTCPATDLKISLCMFSVWDLWTRLRDFSFLKAIRLALGPTQPPSQCLLGGLACINNHSLPCSVRTCLYLFFVWLWVSSTYGFWSYLVRNWQCLDFDTLWFCWIYI